MCCTFFCPTGGVAPVWVLLEQRHIFVYSTRPCKEDTLTGHRGSSLCCSCWVSDRCQARWAPAQTISWNLTAVIDHNLGSVYKKVKDLWVSLFFFQRISRLLILGTCLFQIFIHGSISRTSYPPSFQCIFWPLHVESIGIVGFEIWIKILAGALGHCCMAL